MADKEAFNAMVVHELRTPLALISGSSDTILRHQDLKEEAKVELVAAIKDSSNSMLEMVSAILDLAKMEAGKFGVTKEKSDLGELLRETTSAFKPLAEEKKLELVYLEKELPLVKMDPFRIRQVINNLLANAIKYSDHGKVTITTKEEANMVTVSVADQGRGMKADEMTNLFERFQRLSSAKGSNGTGLGLAVARGIVEAHGGKIWVTSKLEVGSTFNFSLPIN